MRSLSIETADSCASGVASALRLDLAFPVCSTPVDHRMRQSTAENSRNHATKNGAVPWTAVPLPTTDSTARTLAFHDLAYILRDEHPVRMALPHRRPIRRRRRVLHLAFTYDQATQS